MFVAAEWPGLWTLKQQVYFKGMYPWLTAKAGKLGCLTCQNYKVSSISRAPNSSPSVEWISNSVGPSHESAKRCDQLSKFRKKIEKHSFSKYHKAATEVKDRLPKSGDVDELLYDGIKKHETCTEKVFRSAYMIAKENFSYTDLPKLIDLQTCNNVDMGVILHSETSCRDIINSISSSMKFKICNNIVSNSSKFSVLVDESTTVSGKSCLIIHLSYVLQNIPTVMFLDIVELPKTDAATITTYLINALAAFGFDSQFLTENLICFACDGASVMLGMKSGVATQLATLVPDVIIWHCCNHRLELAVDDAVKSTHGINPFKIFIDSLYALYHPSPKNQAELKAAASDLGSQLSKIGRVLDTRWAASSLRSLEAVWKSFSALAKHFQTASLSDEKSSKEKSKFRGLHKTLCSTNFVQNLAIMLDALKEVAKLSELLQTRGLSLISANRLIQQSINALKLKKSNVEKCFYFSQVKHFGQCESDVQMSFRDVELAHIKTVILLNRAQVFQSLIDSMESRLLTTSASRNQTAEACRQKVSDYKNLLSQIELLNRNSWPIDYEEQSDFGELKIKALAVKLRVNVESSLDGFKFLKAGLDNVEQLLPLSNALACIPISTADCERGFSCMNNILTPKRNRLDIANLSSLMFISLVGPAVQDFNPTSYSRAWLRSGRHSACDTKSMKRQKLKAKSYYSHCHDLLK